jgi:biopolymer transport protein ExbD
MAAMLSESDEGEALSDINVTPLVDVVLVLLIVFMITVPAMVSSSQVDVKVPESTAIAAEIAESETLPLTIYVKQDEGETKVFLGDKTVKLNSFTPYLQSLKNIDREAAVRIAADEALPYGDVVSVMDSLSTVGIHKLSLETKHVD